MSVKINMIDQLRNGFSKDDSYGFFDWFCKEESLRNKSIMLMKKVKQIAFSKKFNISEVSISFNNNHPINGALYDDITIRHIKSGSAIYTIVPASGHTSYEGNAQVWGTENDFDEPLVHGSWKDVKTFFGV